MRLIYLLVSALAFHSTSCEKGGKGVSSAKSNEFAVSEGFKQYWYTGEAEINSYDLFQSRYGQVREGDAVLIFVTEDFSERRQVKLDEPEKNKEDRVSVLKLNLLKKFHTGIYDYSIMQSVFTPVDLGRAPHTLKVTFSSQDWCGQSFTQANLVNDQYKIKQFSYFESEGDKEFSLGNVLLEDEIWTRLRIAPSTIPRGRVDIIPAVMYARLQHGDLELSKANIEMQTAGEEQERICIQYLNLERKLCIEYQAEFPYGITRWEEINGADTTRAVLRKSIKNAYWTKNSKEFDYLRDTLNMLY